MAIQKDFKARPYVSKWLNAMHLMIYLSTFAIISVADSASDMEVMSVSCAGTGLVLAFGCFSLRDKMIERNQIYLVKHKTTKINSHTELQNPDRQMEISVSAELWVLSPPPNSPAYNSINIADASDVSIRLSP